jgi:predicted TPR repeat methyltransferase
MQLPGIPDYRHLDATGESQAAAARMEARAREPASDALFQALVVPHLTPAPARILEIGCGTAALSRRLAQTLPRATIHASDKSEGMLAAAAKLLDPEQILLATWDLLEERGFPFGPEPYDLIVSSVVVPYLGDAETADLVRRLTARLTPGGLLLFVEQDLQTDALHLPDYDLLRRVFAKDARGLKRSHGLGLRPLLREAGLDVLAHRSFLWTDTGYGPYLRDLLGRMADDAVRDQRILGYERAAWTETLERLHATGDFWYGLVYHAVAGRKG